MGIYASVKRLIVLLVFLVVDGLADDILCENTDEGMTSVYECLALNDDEFVFLSKRWPTFSDGKPYDEEGTVTWSGKSRWVREKSTQFKKNGIVYVVYPVVAAYECDCIVFNTKEQTVADINFWDGINEYGRYYYNCGYRSEIELPHPDTTFAETEFQRYISAEDLIGVMLTGNIDEIGPWKIYRTDGTLKFVGDVHGGYCMSKNGMKKTKKVTSAVYCK